MILLLLEVVRSFYWGCTLQVSWGCLHNPRKHPWPVDRKTNILGNNNQNLEYLGSKMKLVVPNSRRVPTTLVNWDGAVYWDLPLTACARFDLFVAGLSPFLGRVIMWRLSVSNGFSDLLQLYFRWKRVSCHGWGSSNARVREPLWINLGLIWRLSTWCTRRCMMRAGKQHPHEIILITLYIIRKVMDLLLTSSGSWMGEVQEN